MGKEGTWWWVLDVDRDAQTALVIAYREIVYAEYNETWEDMTWEKCTLRQWLNGEYYENTFSEEEKEAILSCKVHTPDNMQYKIKGGALILSKAGGCRKTRREDGSCRAYESS